jgi:iron(III)-enterobactin esterase
MKHFVLLASSAALVALTACGGGGSGGAAGAGASSAGSSVGGAVAGSSQGGAPAGAGTSMGSASGASSPSGQAATSGSNVGSTAGSTRMSGSSSGGSSGAAAGGSGVSGSSLEGGVAQEGGATTPGITDPGTEGDGDFTIGPMYTPDPLSVATNVPVGHVIEFQMLSSDSKIYPGIKGPYSRSVWVYVPQQYVPGTAAPFIVVQDGSYACWWGNNVPHTFDPKAANLPGTANIPNILDNLIAAKMLPKIVVLFVDNGGGDAQGSERGLEYDTVSGLFAEFVESEVIPRVTTEVQSQLSIALTLTEDPEGRATLGGSSGGAASFSMAWWHPEYFHKVLTYSATLIDQASPENPLYPNGCACYHDFAPNTAAMPPNGLVMEATTNEPIRMWLESAQNDNQVGGGLFHDFKVASMRMAASFKAKGYHYHYDYALAAGHLDGNVVAQTLPSALLWLWRGYPIE